MSEKKSLTLCKILTGRAVWKLLKLLRKRKIIIFLLKPIDSPLSFKIIIYITRQTVFIEVSEKSKKFFHPSYVLSFGKKVTTFNPQAYKVYLAVSKEIGDVIGQKSNYFRYTTSEFSLLNCLIKLCVERMIKSAFSLNEL